jgi:amino acid transporter
MSHTLDGEMKVKEGHGGRPSYNGGAVEGNADELLNILGYQSELVRSRSTFQVAFMSFVLASVPYGLATTLLYPIAGGGPVAVIWGWCGVCAIIACLAVSLGEITSVYPTAGGVYYQTFMLSPPGSRRILAWICGWAYALGNVIITLSVNFGTTLFFVGCVNIFQKEDGTGVWETKTYHYYLVFLAITIVCNLISALGNRWLPILDVGRSGPSILDFPKADHF